MSEKVRSSAEKSAATKQIAYANKVKQALVDLCSDHKRKNLTISDVCTHAGVSSDPIYKPHHKDLREVVETQIESWRLAIHGRK